MQWYHGIHPKVKTVLLKLFVINRAFMHQKEIRGLSDVYYLITLVFDSPVSVITANP